MEKLLLNLQLLTSSFLTEVVINAYGGAVDISTCSFKSILMFVLSLSGPRNNQCGTNILIHKCMHAYNMIVP